MLKHVGLDVNTQIVGDHTFRLAVISISFISFHVVVSPKHIPWYTIIREPCGTNLQFPSFSIPNSKDPRLINIHIPHLPDWALNMHMPPYNSHQRPIQMTPRYSSTYTWTHDTLLSSHSSYISTDRIRIWRWKWIAWKKTRKCVQNKLMKKLYPVCGRVHSLVSASFCFQQQRYQE